MSTSSLNVDEMVEVADSLRPLTMVGAASLVSLATQARHVLEMEVPGHFVECGVWRGGASFLMAEILRRAGVEDRLVWMFDSFEGLPPPGEIDGLRAQEYAGQTNSPWYHDNCSASFEEVKRNAAQLGLTPYIRMVKGWFEATLPAHQQQIGEIALLRLDCDWYSSVRCCLANLYERVVEGGFVVLDDYYAYEGCALAVHEFLAERGLPHRIESVIGERGGWAYNESAFFRKASDASPPRTQQPLPAWARRCRYSEGAKQ